MRSFLYCLLLVSLLLGCRSARPPHDTTPLDSLSGRVAAVTVAGPNGLPLAVLPSKCKGCQFTVVVGNDNHVAQASTAKKATGVTGDANKTASGKSKAPVALADSGAVATDQREATNAVSHQGSGDAIEQRAVKPQAPDWKAVIAGKVGDVLQTVLLVAAIAGTLCGLYWLVFIRRRKTETTT